MDSNQLLPSIPIDRENKLHYQQNKSVLIKNFFSPKLISLIHASLPNLKFYGQEFFVAHGVAIREQVARPKFMNLILELMNDRSLITSLEQITNIHGLTNFNGRLYKMDQNLGSMGWHQDLDGNKKLAVTINIGPNPFMGGELLIRKKSSGQGQRFHNTGTGDAILFEVHPEYEHCVLPVKGEHDKLAITGWYHSPEVYL